MILGVTASGKAGLAFELARQIDAELISIDSMKIYRRMDIGTAKPSISAQKEVNYHLIDVAEPSESFSVASFLQLADSAAEKIQAKGKPVIASGGTALYIKAMLFGLFEGPGSDEAVRKELNLQLEQTGRAEMHKKLTAVDPDAAVRIHLNDTKRVIRALEVYELTGRPISDFQQQWNGGPKDHNWTIIGLNRPKEVQSSRINARVKKMIQLGLVAETAGLLAEEEPLSDQARCAIGYAEIIEHLQGEISLEDAVEKIKINTRRFAKSQRTWFKTFGSVTWIDIEEDDTPEQILDKTLSIL